MHAFSIPTSRRYTVRNSASPTLCWYGFVDACTSINHNNECPIWLIPTQRQMQRRRRLTIHEPLRAQKHRKQLMAIHSDRLFFRPPFPLASIPYTYFFRLAATPTSSAKFASPKQVHVALHVGYCEFFFFPTSFCPTIRLFSLRFFSCFVFTRVHLIRTGNWRWLVRCIYYTRAKLQQECLPINLHIIVFSVHRCKCCAAAARWSRVLPCWGASHAAGQ